MLKILRNVHIICLSDFNNRPNWQHWLSPSLPSLHPPLSLYLIIYNFLFADSFLTPSLPFLSAPFHSLLLSLSIFILVSLSLLQSHYYWALLYLVSSFPRLFRATHSSFAFFCFHLHYPLSLLTITTRKALGLNKRKLQHLPLSLTTRDAELLKKATLAIK